MSDLKWEEIPGGISVTYDAHPSVGTFLEPAGMCFPRNDTFPGGAAPVGEMRGISWLDFQLAKASDWWENSQDAKALRVMIDMASIVFPELWAARPQRVVEVAEVATKAVTRASSALDDIEYLERLQRYLGRSARKIKVNLEWGEEAVAELAKDGHAGVFRVLDSRTGRHAAIDTPKQFLTGEILINPLLGMTRLTIHHELTHMRDLLRFYNLPNPNMWRFYTESWQRELYVSVRLALSRRWFEAYNEKSITAQVAYIKRVFHNAIKAGQKPNWADPRSAWAGIKEADAKFIEFMRRHGYDLDPTKKYIPDHLP